MSAVPDLPYATPGFEGTGGTIRNRAEDFFVQELPLYEASGEGGHVFFEAQKTGLTTREAVRRIAQALGIAARDIGYAGLKDRHAVTRQLFSVPAGRGVDAERIMNMSARGVLPLWAARHGNKLRVGQLAGNRFAVKIREVNPTDVTRLRPLLDRLGRQGLPNYYGAQRFGIDPGRSSDALGLAMVRGDWQRFCDLLLGGNDPRGDVQSARRLYDAGDLAGALAVWPGNVTLERRVLEVLVRTGDAQKAAMAVDRSLRRLYVSAAQSAVFNRVVAQRVQAETLGKVLPGDVAVKHVDELRTGGMFLVENAAVEQARADRWEISATGPMFGRKMMQAGGEIARAEQASAKSLGVLPEHFASEAGARRPLRVRPLDTTLAAGTDEYGGHITLAFTLPAGSFATVLLREVMKS